MDRVLGADFGRITSLFEGKASYGEEVRYGERYDAIQREIQKLTAASSKETSVDWGEVRKLSIELLSEESKDLSIACFLTVALFLVDGYGGARDGLEIVRIFIDDHWEGIFPPIKRKVRRANDLRWLVERLAPLVETREADAQESEHLAVLVETAVALGERSRELLQESAPSFGELISNLKSRADEAESEKQESPPPEPATAAEEPKESEDQKEKEAEPAVEKAQEPAPAPQEPAKETPPTSPPRKTAAEVPAITIEEGASAQEIRLQIEAIVKPLRDADPLNPAPYRIIRTLKWEGVSGPSTAGQTKIPGPRPNDLAPIQPLLDAANWSGLLEKCESLFKAGHIWLLDLQRYTTQCLENLDPRGSDSPAAAAVRETTRDVLQRNPALVDCTFASGLPFASDETRTWLAEISNEEGFRIGMMRPSSDEGAPTGFEAGEIEKAVQFLRKKKLTEGMGILQHGLDRASTPRSQFRTRLDAATACLDANRTLSAQSMLEDLQQKAEEGLTFDQWERAWAVELYQLLAICYGRLAKASKGEERKRFSTKLSEVRNILYSLDMHAAAAVEEAL